MINFEQCSTSLQTFFLMDRENNFILLNYFGANNSNPTPFFSKVYIYVYIEKEREKKRQRQRQREW